MKKFLIIFAIVLAFTAGVFCHAVWPSGQQTKNENASDPVARNSAAQSVSLSGIHGNIDRRRSAGSRPNSDRPAIFSRSVSLDFEGKFLEFLAEEIAPTRDVLLRMGLSQKEIETFEAIREDANKRKLQIEVDNAVVGSDQQGEFIAISRWPTESLLQWSNALESDLRGLLPDGRAVVLAKMVASSELADDSPYNQRTIRATSLDGKGGGYQIEEQFSNEAGEVTAVERHAANSTAAKRWRHIFVFDEE